MTAEQPIVLITGGSSGIGKATAKRLLEPGGAQGVVICGRDLDRLNAAIAELAPDPERFHAVQADVTEASHIAHLIDSTLAKFGRIDALVNSAGAGYLGPFAETPADAMERLWRVNVQGAMAVTQAVLPDMTARKSGHIINLCGVLGVKTIANATLYCATKHALVGFGGALAQEVKRSQIRVTSLCCSGVDSPFWEGVPGKPRAEILLSPDDVALEIVALLAQPAHVITNQVLYQHVAHQL